MLEVGREGPENGTFDHSHGQRRRN